MSSPKTKWMTKKIMKPVFKRLCLSISQLKVTQSIWLLSPGLGTQLFMVNILNELQMRGHFLLWKKTRKQYILIQRVFKIWNFNHKGVFPFVHVYYRLLNGILFYFFINLFIYLFLSALGLCYCTWAFSSCGELGLHFIAVHRLLTAVASLVA